VIKFARELAWKDGKIKKNLIQNSRSPIGDLNSGQIEYEAGIPPPTIVTLIV
jgi:hypothetical protein